MSFWRRHFRDGQLNFAAVGIQKAVVQKFQVRQLACVSRVRDQRLRERAEFAACQASRIAQLQARQPTKKIKPHFGWQMTKKGKNQRL